MIRKFISKETITVEGVSFEPGDVVAVYDSRVSPATLFGIMPPGWCSVEAIEPEASVSMPSDESSEDEPSGDAEQLSNDADASPSTGSNANTEDDGLEPLDIPAALKRALRENAAALEDDRLLSPEGIKAWIAEGNDPDKDLEGVGPKFATILKEKYAS
jgi:hypothetical protein